MCASASSVTPPQALWVRATHQDMETVPALCMVGSTTIPAVTHSSTELLFSQPQDLGNVFVVA